MDPLLQDLRYAARTLIQDRGFAAAALFTLSICIAANAAVFGIIDAVLLSPLPYDRPERLVTMWNAYPGAGVAGRGMNGASDYVQRRELEVFEELAAYQGSGVSIELGGLAARVRSMRVTPGLFPLLGATAGVGRTFTEAEGELGSHRSVLLSHDLARELFGADVPLGSSLVIDGEAHEIVGMMPAGWWFEESDIRLWTPLAFSERQLQAVHSNNSNMLARLADGVSIEQAQQRIDALNERNMERTPEIAPLLINAGFHTPLYFWQDDLVRDVRGTLYLLWGGALFVLLIGCLNVANLTLVRSSIRARELATRFALGARAGRVARQLLTETVLLALAAAGLGLLLGRLALGATRALLADQLPRAHEIGISATAVAVVLGIALAVGILVTLLPLATIARQDLSAVFREEGRSGTAGRGVRLTRKGMVVAQVAFALMLLVGAALLLASFRQLLGVDPGFEPAGVLTGRISLPDATYGEVEADHAMVAEVTNRLGALPGVVSAAAINQVPFGWSNSDSVIFAEGYVPEPGESPISPLQYVVTDGYFETLGVRLVQGRLLGPQDNRDGEPVIMIDQRLARRFFPDGDAVGRRMWQPGDAANLMDMESANFFRIVGVVESVAHRGLAESDRPVGAYYLPIEQLPFGWGSYYLLLKTDGDPRALAGGLRATVAEIDPQLPVYDVQMLSDRIAGSLSDRRSPLLLTLVFGGVALLLAAVGIYGVLAHLVALRTREMGIRIALGSDAGGVFRLVLGEGAAIIGLGVVLGLAGAYAVGRALRAQLYGVSALDPLVLVSVTALLTLVALVACWVPARRATRIDPVEALTGI